MTIRSQLYSYLLGVHILLAAVAGYAFRETPALVFAIEAVWLISFITGLWLIRKLIVPIDLIRSGSELIRDSDFGVHIRPVPQPELNDLVQVFNRMMDRLREERLNLQERQFFLEKIVAASPAGILVCDLEHRIVKANTSAARLLGRPHDTLGGIKTEDLAIADLPDWTALDPSSPQLVSVGRRRLRISRGTFVDRGFTHSFFLIEELTDELRSSEKSAYETLIRIISHEVNNSVGAVSSLVQSLLHYDNQISSDHQEDFRKAISVSRERLENLTSFIRGFAEVVRLPLPDRRPCRLDQMLKDVLLLLGPELAARAIVLNRRIGDEPLTVTVDKNQIEQVIINVIRNSLEAAGQGGTIDVSLVRSDEQMEMTIADSGPGITSEVGEKLFTPFFTTKREGRGLGLTLSEAILNQHGLNFSLGNRPAGGAEFRILFHEQTETL